MKMMKREGVLHCLLCLLVWLTVTGAVSGREAAATVNTQAQRIMESKLIVSAFKAVFTAPPERTPAKTSVDGPLLGNGDMGVAIGGPPEAQQFILCKNDMWRLQHGYGNASPVPFGTLLISVPALQGASYRVVQDLYTATTKGVFELDRSAVTLKTYVAATANVFVVELTARGQSFAASASMDVALGRGSDSKSFAQGHLHWGRRGFSQDVDIASAVAAAWTVFDAKMVPVGQSFVLKPGKTMTLVLAMDSLFKHRDYVGTVKERIRSIDAKRLHDMKAAHKQWWADYYARSYVSIHDPVIEKQYYLSLYGMGSCSRDPNFPPPIFGWTTQDNPSWHGDYHLNYNHMAPFYGMARANRLAQADPHDAPILDFMARAQWHCREIFGFDGVMYPVGIGPKGIESTYGNPGYIKRGPVCAENKGLFFGQRSNAAYALVNMAPRWYSTYDHAYGKRIYPLVREIATFWEHYVIWDETQDRYIIDKDSVHEGSGQDLNACLSLGLVRNALRLALDMSQTLNRDAERRDQWRHILKHLSNYSFQEKGGKTVFRYTEKGTAWWQNNTLGIQQIYPAGQIHLDSDPELLEVSRNTIEVMQRWLDGNGSNSFFPAAVRIGYDPVTILEQLRKYAKHSYPNGFQAGNPHGIENLSTVPNTINEMLCMGHKGVLRVFPVWPKHQDAAFTQIRCWGAFLVSAELKNGRVKQVSIFSEKGRDCRMVNPWPGQKLGLYCDGKRLKTLKGKRLSFESQAGTLYQLKTL
jgi:alpha-L-fucosidase 2